MNWSDLRVSESEIELFVRYRDAAWDRYQESKDILDFAHLTGNPVYVREAEGQMSDAEAVAQEWGCFGGRA